MHEVYFRTWSIITLSIVEGSISAIKTRQKSTWIFDGFKTGLNM